jgi:hypothetical protein
MAVKIEIYWQDLEYSKLREILRTKGFEVPMRNSEDLIERLAGEHLSDGPLAVIEVEPIIGMEHLNGTT